MLRSLLAACLVGPAVSGSSYPEPTGANLTSSLGLSFSSCAMGATHSMALVLNVGGWGKRVACRQYGGG